MGRVSLGWFDLRVEGGTYPYRHASSSLKHCPSRSSPCSSAWMACMALALPLYPMRSVTESQ